MVDICNIYNHSVLNIFKPEIILSGITGQPSFCEVILESCLISRAFRSTGDPQSISI